MSSQLKINLKKLSSSISTYVWTDQFYSLHRWAFSPALLCNIVNSKDNLRSQMFIMEITLAFAEFSKYRSALLNLFHFTLHLRLPI